MPCQLPAAAQTSCLRPVTEAPGLPVAVVDSSVLAFRWSRFILQQLAERKNPLYVPVWSEWIIAETWRTLAFFWLNRAGDPFESVWPSLTRAANDMLNRLLPVMRFVSLRDYTGPAPWPLTAYSGARAPPKAVSALVRCHKEFLRFK